MATIDLADDFGGDVHKQAVYFARIGDLVKIGTTTRIRQRLYAMYLHPGDLLWIELGDERSERFYHQKFRDCHEPRPSQRELFRLEGELKAFLDAKPTPIIEYRWELEPDPSRVPGQVTPPAVPAVPQTRRSTLSLISEARRLAASGSARDLRQQAGLTQAQVAKKCNVSRPAVAAWEAGRSLPKGKHALAYGRLLRDLANWTA